MAQLEFGSGEGGGLELFIVNIVAATFFNHWVIKCILMNEKILRSFVLKSAAVLNMIYSTGIYCAKFKKYK